MNELALFSGAGGGILGGKLLGWRTVCAVEIDAYAAGILARRQNEGFLAPFPIWDDVRTFDGRPWRGTVDVISGGFPCQDISCAGKGAGISGARSGLWSEFARIIREVEPGFVFVENSPMLTVRGLGRVLWDLAEMGLNAEWGVLGAEDACWNNGRPEVDHERERMWIVGSRTHAYSERELQQEGPEQNKRRRTRDVGNEVSNPDESQCKGVQLSIGIQTQHANVGLVNWWSTEPELGRVAHGVANRMDRLRAIGNGQVPAVVKLAWETLTERL